MAGTARTVFRWVRLVLYTALAMAIVVAPLPGVVEGLFADYAGDLKKPVSGRAYAHFLYIKGHLEAPFTGYGRSQVLVPQFGVVALTHMASGLMNLSVCRPEMNGALTPLVAEVVARALSEHVSPWRVSPSQVADLGDEGLYLSHLNLILGCYRHITGQTDHDALQTRISEHLAARSLRDGDFHAASFPGGYKWPADQTVTLCSLYLYDKTHGTSLAARPTEGWLRYMADSATDKTKGLPHSSISPFWYREIPRGCALSWSVQYMAQFAPHQAAELYQRYRHEYFATVLGSGGFREWPRGQSHSSDVDSGPVVFGMGLAASGLAVGPARIFGDAEAYASILRSTCVAMPTPWWPSRRHLLLPILAEAILFDGETATPWFWRGPPPAAGWTKHFPTALVLAAAVYLGLTILLVWRVKRLTSRLRANRSRAVSSSKPPGSRSSPG